MEVGGLVSAIVSPELSGGEGYEDPGHCCHEKAEGNIAGGLDAGFAAWEATWVNALDRPVAKNESEVAVRDLASIPVYHAGHGIPHWVEDRVRHRCEQR